jgi:hypothetical protein
VAVVMTMASAAGERRTGRCWRPVSWVDVVRCPVAHLFLAAVVATLAGCDPGDPASSNAPAS